MFSKEKVYSSFLELARSKTQSLQRILDDLRETGANETKSTAGDKHETALAMVQIEQENIRRQLTEAGIQVELLELLEMTDVKMAAEKVIRGSLVKTNRGYFFLSTALGKITVADITVISVSPQSPLGGKLLGKSKNDTVEVNGILYSVDGIE